MFPATLTSELILLVTLGIMGSRPCMEARQRGDQVEVRESELELLSSRSKLRKWATSAAPVHRQTTVLTKMSPGFRTAICSRALRVGVPADMSDSRLVTPLSCARAAY